MHPAETSPALALAGIRKRFRRRGLAAKVAVDDVTLSLAPGACLGLVGESGSGKSTLARIAVGLLAPDAGRVMVAGEDTSRRPRGRAARLRRASGIQMVFQDPYLSLDPRLTAAACVEGVLRLHGERSGPARRERARDLLEQVGLGPREADALPRRLSGGQRQRVAIAWALAPRPRVLVLDEAVSALDVSVQAQILELIDRLRAEHGIAVLFVSHDLAVVRHVSDRIAIMRDGQIVETGATGEVLRRPTQPYTRLLVAAAPSRGWNPARAAQLRRELADSA